jgi:hypothetical protein
MLKSIMTGLAAVVLWTSGEYHANCDMFGNCDTFLDTRITAQGKIVYQQQNTHADPDVCQEAIDAMFETAQEANTARRRDAMAAAEATYVQILPHRENQCLPEGTNPNTP